MQEDMRLTLPARGAERPKRPVEEAIVKVLRTRGTLAERERDAVQYEVKAGHCLVIDAVMLVDDAKPEGERVEVRLVPQRGLTPEQETRATIRIRPKPGEVLTLYAMDWTSSTPRLDPEQVLDAYHRLSGGYGDTTRATCIEAMRRALAGEA